MCLVPKFRPLHSRFVHPGNSGSQHPQVRTPGAATECLLRSSHCWSWFSIQHQLNKQLVRSFAQEQYSLSRVYPVEISRGLNCTEVFNSRESSLYDMYKMCQILAWDYMCSNVQCPPEVWYHPLLTCGCDGGSASTSTVLLKFCYCTPNISIACTTIYY